MYSSLYFSKYVGRNIIIKNIMMLDNLVLNILFKEDILDIKSNQMHKLCAPKIVPMEKIYVIEV